MPFLMGPGEVHFGGVVLKGQLSSVSEANREGVEGEPQATLGGLLGSPRIGQWCRFCGSIANPSSDQCVECWAGTLSKTMEISGTLTDEFIDAMDKLASVTGVLAGALSPPQPHDPATP